MKIAPILEQCARVAIAYAEAATVKRPPAVKARLGHNALLIAGATLTGIASIVCMTTALWIALIPYCGAAGSPAVIACIMAIGCLSLLGLFRSGQTPRIVTSAPSEAPLMPREPALPLLIGALLTGLAMGSSRK